MPAQGRAKRLCREAPPWVTNRPKPQALKGRNKRFNPMPEIWDTLNNHRVREPFFAAISHENGPIIVRDDEIREKFSDFTS